MSAWRDDRADTPGANRSPRLHPVPDGTGTLDASGTLDATRPRRAARTGEALWPGDARELGARVRTGPDGLPGVNFALSAPDAEAVDLCLFDSEGTETRLRLRERTGRIWHGFVPGAAAGCRYGYRVHGRWDPWTGARFNPAKLLLDPYARAVDGPFTLTDSVYGHVRDWPEAEAADTVRDNRDSAPDVPKAVVVAETPAPPGLHTRPGTPWSDTVLYETHVKGFTKLHPDIPEGLRGTYAGLAHPAAIEHLRRIGVTAVELQPVHQFTDEEHLAHSGLSNYWGYNTIGYFAPHAGYAASGSGGEQVAEFRRMVGALHQAGIEVILDVVYNHTAEGGSGGPTLSLRGIDNAGYYRLLPQELRHTLDVTGCGNSLDAGRPQVLRLITDSLRYWVTEMGVDGFRFDLATALARNPETLDQRSPFLTALAQDPVLAGVKLIAEPWDIGPDGYQVGAFPQPWAEWNDRYRDGVRDYWRGRLGELRELGYRLSGSSDLYQHSGRQPGASINFITSHDGFTLRDLVSYNGKHNEANGEDNRDGTDSNRSWNCGTEGETDDRQVRELRRRQQRNLLATLMLSTGTPMLLAGDEMDRTQQGNNNAYCQDNPLSWVDWTAARTPEGRQLTEFTALLTRLRREHPVLRRGTFFRGATTEQRPGELPDLSWFTPAGREMTDADWFEPGVSALGMLWSGTDIGERDEFGRERVGESLLLLVHAGSETGTFRLPGTPWASGYRVLLDTSAEAVPAHGTGALHPSGTPLPLPPRSLLLLRALPAPGRGPGPGPTPRQIAAPYRR